MPWWGRAVQGAQNMATSVQLMQQMQPFKVPATLKETVVHSDERAADFGCPFSRGERPEVGRHGA